MRNYLFMGVIATLAFSNQSYGTSYPCPGQGSTPPYQAITCTAGADATSWSCSGDNWNTQSTITSSDKPFIPSIRSTTFDNDGNGVCKYRIFTNSQHTEGEVSLIHSNPAITLSAKCTSGAGPGLLGFTCP